MAHLDLSGLTVAELTTLKTELLASYSRSLTSKSYKIGTRGLDRAEAASLLEQIASISSELRARTSDSDGVGLVGFNEQL